MSWIKKTFFYIVTAVIIVIILELGSLALLKMLGKPKQEVFPLNGFLELVTDMRLYTLKKSYLAENISGACTDIIKTNDLGYRVPPDNLKTRLETFLFIGDSVPFGWCVNAEDSLPYQFSKLRPDFSVINGAIPSYSLSQAKSRLIIEFNDIHNVSLIFLQIYDPAGSYARLGYKWEESDNWHTKRARDSNLCALFDSQNPLSKTNLGEVVNKIYKRVVHGNCFFPSTDASDARYVSHIRQQIQVIKDFADRKGAILIVAPVTPSPRGLLTLPTNYKHAIKLTNVTLENVSKELGAVFFETKSFLKDSDFIDDCCHLSGSGAQKVAVELHKKIGNLVKRPSEMK
jgi:hypothetical protein